MVAQRTGMVAQVEAHRPSEMALSESPMLVRSRHMGLNFEAPFPVGEALVDGCQADVTVHVAQSAPLPQDDPGTVVAELKARNGAGYTVYSLGGAYVFRFHGLCEFELSGDGRSVVCLPGPDCEHGLLEVLMEGTISAWLLTLRGFAVLHGSTVRSGNLTFVFAGCSGIGKSTVAALCCAAGARFVADDVVALQQGPEGIASAGLGTELRLRPQAFHLAELFRPRLTLQRLTADGRLAIRPPRAPKEHNVISAVFLPRPTRDSSEVMMRPLEPTQAMLRLLANARIQGMVPVDMQKVYFGTVSALAASVPVLEVRVPSGPPFQTDLGRKLLTQAAVAARHPERS